MSDTERVGLKERFTRIEFVVVIAVVTIALLIFSTAIPRAWALWKRLTWQEKPAATGVALRMHASESSGNIFHVADVSALTLPADIAGAR